MKDAPDALENFKSIFGVEQIVPLGPSELENLPRLITVRDWWEVAAPVGNHFEISPMYTQVQNSQMVIDR